MIRIKTQEEIAILKEGGAHLARILDEVCSLVRPGADTAEMEELACRLMREAGGRPAFKHLLMPDGRRFPTALCTSINHEIVHAPAKPGRKLREGDCIGVDVGMEYPFNSDRKPVNGFSAGGGYYTDMARTLGVGEVSEEALRLMNATKRALDLAIQKAGPGVGLNTIGGVIQDYVEPRGLSVVRELVGHGVGHAVHEEPQVPHYRVLDKSLPNVVLEPGMVIAIEPMITTGDWRIRTGKDGFVYETADGSLSAQFEHTIVITEKGREILTK